VNAMTEYIPKLKTKKKIEVILIKYPKGTEKEYSEDDNEALFVWCLNHPSCSNCPLFQEKNKCPLPKPLHHPEKFTK